MTKNNINTELTEETLVNILNIFQENEIDFKIEDMEIKIAVDNFKLRKFDEYLFFKHNPKAPKSNFEHTPEVKINIGGLKFTLFEKNEKEKLIFKLDEFGNEYQEIE